MMKDFVPTTASVFVSVALFFSSGLQARADVRWKPDGTAPACEALVGNVGQWLVREDTRHMVKRGTCANEPIKYTAVLYPPHKGINKITETLNGVVTKLWTDGNGDVHVGGPPTLKP